jgi:hypothetical protein
MFQLSSNIEGIDFYTLCRHPISKVYSSDLQECSPNRPKRNCLPWKNKWYYRPRLKEIYKPRSMICSTLIPYAKSLCNASLDISSHFHPICAHSSSSPYRRTYFRISESEMIPLRRFSSSITTSRWTLDFRIVSKIESSLSSSLHV